MSRFLAAYNDLFMKSTDGCLEYAQASGLSCLSAIALSRRWIDRGSGIHPNLYMLLVGESSRDRKSTSIKMARQLIDKTESERVGPADFTAEGLVFHMRKKKVGHSRNRLLLPIEEFGTLLASTGSYNVGLGATLCALYDGENYSRVRSGKRPVHVEKPRLSLIGGCAYGMLEAYANPREWTTGLFARFLFVTPQHTRERFAVQPNTPPGERDIALKALQELNRYLKDNRCPMKSTPDADQVIREFSGSFPETDDPAAIAQRERLINATWKLALLFQIDENPETHIGEQAAHFACYLASQSWKSFLKIRELTDIDQIGKMQQRVLRLIEATGTRGLPRGDLHKICGGRAHLTAAVELLIKNDRIFVKNTVSGGLGGRPKSILVSADAG